MAAACIGAGVALVGGAVSANQASQAAKGARNDAARARQEMAAIKASRAKIVNHTLMIKILVVWQKIYLA